jgi:hypothetical protein
MPILESALGVENAFAIATAAPSVAALTIGLEDYTADMGVVKTPEGAESLWARSRLVNAARAGGVQAIDSVYGDVADEEGLLAWGRRARGMGFQGMGCIHPRQIRIIHEAFAPSREELAKALKIVAAFEEAERKGLGVVSLGTKMIDRPVVLRARRLVERAREAGLVAEAEPGKRPGARKGERSRNERREACEERRRASGAHGGEREGAGPLHGRGSPPPSGAKAAPPIRSCRDYPPHGDKRVPDLRTALEKCGLRSGMTISSHHHLRNGDRVALEALRTAGEMGARDLMWFPSASFPCHEPVIELMEQGVVHHIEGSMNGPLGRYTSEGKMRGMGVLRSHGGRYQADPGR